MSKHEAAPHWIAVDWSASGIRAWALDQSGTVLMKVRSAQGLAQVATSAFETVLFNLVRPWLLRDRTPIIVSGLPRSLQASVPTTKRPADAAVLPLATADPRLALFAVPGPHLPREPEVTFAHDGLIRGVAAERPEFRGAICIPDTLTQWVRIEAGQITKTRLSMTAELAELLIPHGTDVFAGPEVTPVLSIFDAAVSDALLHPEAMMESLVPARFDNDPAKARLKGLLIGTDLAGTRDVWRMGTVMVVNSSPWSFFYQRALKAQGVEVRSCDTDFMALAGLKHAYGSLCETFA